MDGKAQQKKDKAMEAHDEQKKEVHNIEDQEDAKGMVGLPTSEIKGVKYVHRTDVEEVRGQYKHFNFKKVPVGVPVPEYLRKAWDKKSQIKAVQRARREKERLNNPAKLHSQANRIERYEEEYYKERVKIAKFTFVARCKGNFYVPPEPKVMVIVRIRGVCGVSCHSKRSLRLMRLLQINNCVFIRLNKASLKMIRRTKPYIAYGYPSVELIRNLIYSRGFAAVRIRRGFMFRMSIMSNNFIQEHMPKSSGVETIEDMVYQIYTCGPWFKEVTSFLWPFKLQPPQGGYRGSKKRHYNDHGTFGNWGYNINSFVMSMI